MTGTSGQVLTSNGASAPAWRDVPGSYFEVLNREGYGQTLSLTTAAFAGGMLVGDTNIRNGIIVADQLQVGTITSPGALTLGTNEPNVVYINYNNYGIGPVISGGDWLKDGDVLINSQDYTLQYYQDIVDNKYGKGTYFAQFPNVYVQSGNFTVQNGSVTAGAFTTSGTVTALNFNATSDYRIKENVVPLDASFVVDNLKPVYYTNTKTNKQDTGFIAHEVQEIFPHLVTGEKDAKDMQTINYQAIIPILVKEIQELKARVQELEILTKK